MKGEELRNFLTSASGPFWSGTYSLLAAGEPAQQVSDEWQLAGSAALKINFR